MPTSLTPILGTRTQKAAEGRWQSGKVDRSGRITRCGDRMLRHVLFEVANVVLSVLKKPTALKRWAEERAMWAGAKKAKVALARRLAVLIHQLWVKAEPIDWHHAMAA